MRFLMDPLHFSPYSASEGHPVPTFRLQVDRHLTLQAPAVNFLCLVMPLYTLSYARYMAETLFERFGNEKLRFG